MVFSGGRWSRLNRRSLSAKRGRKTRDHVAQLARFLAGGMLRRLHQERANVLQPRRAERARSGAGRRVLSRWRGAGSRPIGAGIERRRHGGVRRLDAPVRFPRGGCRPDLLL
jgi:hypothetical protein